VASLLSQLKRIELKVNLTSRTSGADVVIVVKIDDELELDKDEWEIIKKDIIAEYIGVLKTEIASALLKKSKLRSVFVPHDKYSLGALWGRSTRLCEGLRGRNFFLDLSSEINGIIDSFWDSIFELGAPYASFWLKTERSFCTASGQATRVELLERLDRLNDIFESVMEGILGFDRSGLKYRYKGVELPMNLSSGLANEVGFTVLALSALKEGSLVLMEEPETQLHPEAQVRFAFAIAKASEELGYKFVIVTHSPYIMLTLALTALDVEVANELAKDIGYHLKLNGRRRVRIYEARGGELRELSPESITYEIPSIFEIDSALTSALNEV